jgi:hypothetical protein
VSIKADWKLGLPRVRSLVWGGISKKILKFAIGSYMYRKPPGRASNAWPGYLWSEWAKHLVIGNLV